MTESNLTKALSADLQSVIDAPDISVCLAFIEYVKAQDKQPDKFLFHKVNIKKALEETFKDIVKARSVDIAEELAITKPVHFDGVTPLAPDEMGVVGIQDHSISRYVKALEDTAAIPIYDHKKFPRTKLHGYVLIVEGTNLERAYYFKKYDAKKELSRSDKFLAVMTSKDSTFDSLDESAFLFDEGIDCAILNDNVVIRTPHAHFQSLFKVHEGIAEKGQAFAVKVVAVLPMTSKENFLQDCKKDYRVLRKLCAIDREIGLTSDIKAKYEKMKDDYGLELDFNDQGELVYDRKKIWDVLRLLGDDNLESRLTGILWRVNSKTLVRKKK